MKLKFVNVGIVLLGQGFDPALFSYESLRTAKIIKRNWELVQAPLTTPTIALLRFNNNLNILVNPNRVQVLLDYPPRDLSKTLLADLAQSVSRRLSRARQSAVGFNISAVIEMENATSYIREKFIKADSLPNFGDLTDVGVNVSHPRLETILNLGINAGVATFENDPHEYTGVVINANYHADLPPNLGFETAVKTVKERIDRIPELYEDFFTLMPQMFELEEEADDTN